MTAEHSHDSKSPELRTEAIETLLVQKGLVESAAVDALVERYEQDIGPLRGARVVAEAWTDAGLRARLLADGMPAIGELGFGDNTDSHVARLMVKENTPSVHNLVVCTLCSCYPWAVLGLPPAWYKSPAYRSRAVREPRRLLAEMGLDLPGDVELRVWDSSAEVRYMVLPERPDGTDGLAVEELADLVTRDSMIGVERLGYPALANATAERRRGRQGRRLPGEAGAEAGRDAARGSGSGLGRAQLSKADVAR